MFVFDERKAGDCSKELFLTRTILLLLLLAEFGLVVEPLLVPFSFVIFVIFGWKEKVCCLEEPSAVLIETIGFLGLLVPLLVP